MITNNDLFMKTAAQPDYLVYLLDECQMGSEGWSGWMYYAVCHGDTDEELYKDWVKQVNHLYGVDLSEDLHCENGVWYSWALKLEKHELPARVLGNSQRLNIEKQYS